MPEWNQFDGIDLSEDARAAIHWAHRAAQHRQLNTIDILVALINVDASGAWTRIQIQSETIDAAAADQFLDIPDHVGTEWDGAVFTRHAALALEVTATLARRYGFTDIPTGLLALGILSDRDFGATRAFLTNASITHDELLSRIQDALLGTHLDSLTSHLLGSVVGDKIEPTPSETSGTSASTAMTERGVTPRSTRKPTTWGRRLGLLVGAGLLTVLGGLPLPTAIAFALVVTYVDSKRKKWRIPKGVLKFISVGVLVSAILLAVTAHSSLSSDLQAVKSLNAANDDIRQSRLVAADKQLGGAGLEAPSSEKILLLGACVDWNLGFKDYASFEAQEAIYLGHNPNDSSGYLNTGCFLDLGPLSGLSYLDAPGFGWTIYTQPDRSDSVGQNYLGLAQATRTSWPAESLVSLACLDNRYDFKVLASNMLTIGLNLNGETGGHPMSQLIQACLKSSSIRDSYGFVVDPSTHFELYLPRDFSARVPSPSKPHPPKGVCWAHFPEGRPCDGGN